MKPKPGLRSALYVGYVRHRRRVDVGHAFRYPVCYLLLDLAEADIVFRLHPWWRLNKPALQSFHPGDYHPDPSVRPGQTSTRSQIPKRSLAELAAAIRAAVAARSGSAPNGRILLLAMPRYAGMAFNPVTFAYLHDQADRVTRIAAEITNTPWRERHVYVVCADPAFAPQHIRAAFAKDFHVSPFLSMDYQYRWAFSPPGRWIGVHMINRSLHGGDDFDATLVLQRRELSRANLHRALLRFPMQAALVLLRIYVQALCLRVKGARFFTHPRHRS